jgi:hypothetical protein
MLITIVVAAVAGAAVALLVNLGNRSSDDGRRNPPGQGPSKGDGAS